MRILEIVPDHPEWTKGGTEFLAKDLTGALGAIPGVDVQFLACTTELQSEAPADGPWQAQDDDLILWTDAYDRFSMTRLDAGHWVPALERAVDALRPDVVHLHGLDRIGVEILPWLRRRLPKCKIVLTLHAYQLLCVNDGLLLTTQTAERCDGPSGAKCHRCFPDHSADRLSLRQAYLQTALGAVDRFIAPSDFLLERHVEAGLPRERFVVIPNALPFPEGAVRAGLAVQVRRERHRAMRNRFAFFGNISEHKGVLVLLEAAERLAQRQADVDIVVHGGLGHAQAPFRERFAAQLERAAPLASHIGPYRREDLPALMQATDWVVVPSIWWENAPLVILEAFRAGRPVICSGIGGMAEMVEDGVNGLHVLPGHAGDLAATIADAAAHPELWDNLVDGIDQPGTIDDCAAEHLALFKTLFAPRRQRPQPSQACLHLAQGAGR